MAIRGTALMLGIAAAVAIGGPATAGSTGKLFGGAAELDSNYFIGHWGMDSADNCEQGDTLSILASGAWAATNGTGNPVEGLGVWSIDGDNLVLTYSEFRDPAAAQTYTIAIGAADDDKFSGEMAGEAVTAWRCQG